MTNLIFDHIDLTIPQNVAPLYVEFPLALQNDVDHKVVTEKMMILSKEYSPLPYNPTPNTSTLVSDDYGSLYHIGDVDTRPVENSPILTFNREWANIPESRSYAAGTMAYSFPGFSNYTTTGSIKTITVSDGITRTTSGSHGFIVGDSVVIEELVRVPSTGYTIYDNYARVVKSVPSATTFVTDPTLTGLNLVSGVVSKANASRQPQNIASPVLYDYTYYLPGVTSGISSAADIPVVDIFKVVNISSGEWVDSLSAYTNPSIEEYLEMVSSGSYIVAECEVSQYRGRLYQRVIKKVKSI